MPEKMRRMPRSAKIGTINHLLAIAMSGRSRKMSDATSTESYRALLQHTLATQHSVPDRLDVFIAHAKLERLAQQRAEALRAPDGLLGRAVCAQPPKDAIDDLVDVAVVDALHREGLNEDALGQRREQPMRLGKGDMSTGGPVSKSKC